MSSVSKRVDNHLRSSYPDLRFLHPDHYIFIENMSKFLINVISQTSRKLLSPRTTRVFPRANCATPPKDPSTPPPGKGKGPITWKTLGVTAGIAATGMAFMFYVKNEKEMGKKRN